MNNFKTIFKNDLTNIFIFSYFVFDFYAKLDIILFMNCFFLFKIIMLERVKKKKLQPKRTPKLCYKLELE